MAEDILPFEIRQLTNVDGDELWSDLQALTALFPVGAERVFSIYASDILWDVPAPPEAIPGDAFGPTRSGDDLCRLLQEAPQLTRLSFNAVYSNALGLSFNRQYADNALLNEGKQDIGWVSPCTFLDKYCFIVCDGVNDRVYIITPSGGPEAMTVQKLAEYRVGKNPVAACQTQAGDIFVACDDGTDVSVWRIANGNPSEIISPGVLAGLTPAVDGFRKIYTNRYGTFLYVICSTGDTAFLDSVLQIDISDPSNTSKLKTQRLTHDGVTPPGANNTAAATEEIADLVIFYPDERTTENAKSFIGICQARTNNAGTTGAIWVIHGDDGSAGDANFGSITFTDSTHVSRMLNPTGQTNEQVRAMVQVGTSLFVLGSHNSEVATAWSVVSYDEQEHDSAATVDSGFVTVTSGTNAQAWNTTGALDVYGSACATDDSVYAVVPNGDVLIWPRGSSTLVIFTPRAGWSDGTGTTVSTKSSCAFNGRTILMQVTDTAAEGESIIFRPL